MIYTIYKIVCEDTNVKYRYVGSTRSFRQRKAEHKRNCYNEKRNEYNSKLYKTIRDNGGWNNWRMVVIAEVDVESKRQAEIIEEEWRVKLNGNLNGKRCYRTEQEKTEQKREYYKNNTEKILKLNKERNKNNAEKIREQVKEWGKKKYNCECGGKYTNSSKSKHIKTDKHQKYLQKTIMTQNINN